MSRFFSPPLTGRHVLMLLLLFFGVVFAANVAFVYFARSTWMGVEKEDAYREGLHYNRTLAEAEAQKQLGWKIADLELVQNDGKAGLVLRLVDSDGAAVRGLNVEATVRRATTDKFDTKVTFSESADGDYRSEVTLLEKGQWLVEVTARRGDTVFRADERFMAP